ncbi:protein of unknown function [Thiomonas sp. X19]|nr:protein of unknown function [Thiomonas sp. X19]VDY15397.1 protein of unknown function [Thiomonas sp. OC7]
MRSTPPQTPHPGPTSAAALPWCRSPECPGSAAAAHNSGCVRLHGGHSSDGQGRIVPRPEVGAHTWRGRDLEKTPQDAPKRSRSGEQVVPKGVAFAVPNQATQKPCLPCHITLCKTALDFGEHRSPRGHRGQDAQLGGLKRVARFFPA